MKDLFGNEIAIGDIIAYPGKKKTEYAVVRGFLAQHSGKVSIRLTKFHNMVQTSNNHKYVAQENGAIYKSRSAVLIDEDSLDMNNMAFKTMKMVAERIRSVARS